MKRAIDMYDDDISLSGKEVAAVGGFFVGIIALNLGLLAASVGVVVLVLKMFGVV